MLIKALCDYYDVLAEKDLVLPDGYSEVPIKYNIVLTPDGKIEDIISCMKTEEQPQKNGKIKEKLVPQTMRFPKRTEKPGIESNTIEHRPLYIFGLNLEKDKLNPEDRTGKAEKSHRAFVEHSLRFIEGLSSPVIDAFRNFLMNWKPEEETENQHILDLGKDYAGAGFAFSLSGNPDLMLHTDPQIKEKWEKEYAKEQSQPGEYQAQCAITGEVSDIARIHSKIKGVAGGAATGGVLIGFNNPSENSYGNDQSYNSNISELAMRKYTEALNYVLKRQAHKIVMDDITIAFWAMDGGDEHEMTLQEMLMSQSSRKTADEVNSMLKSLLSRGMKTRITTNELKELDAELDGNIDFYIVGLKPNSSRISIKFLYRKKFLDMLWNLARFQDELQVSEEVRVVSLSWIKKECLSPKSNSEKISPALFTKLFEAAIYGTNYPYSLLETMIRRVKTDKFINATRAGVIKAYLNRNKKEEWKVSLDRSNNNQAYLCGRLFAVLENIQNQAVRVGKSNSTKLNSTIKDKYFASAAAKPASIFPTLIKLSQHHMKKLNDGSQIFHAKLVGEIMNMLENEFPKTLSLVEQGKFIIGYYQQVQDFFASKKPTEL